jgi:hypothetical protein
VSKEFSAIIVPSLVHYNEVDAGEKLTQEALTTCLAMIFLPFGAVTASYSEDNELQLDLSLLDTSTGDLLWTYTANYTGGLGEQRAAYTKKMVGAFAKYFPLSAAFKE